VSATLWKRYVPRCDQVLGAMKRSALVGVTNTLPLSGLPVPLPATDSRVVVGCPAPENFTRSGSQTPPPFFRAGPSGGNDVVSPGGTIRVAYNLPAGTYVLLCFVADDVTGMPHALMGMHKSSS